MDIAIQQQRNNPLLERKEYELTIEHSGDATPSVSKVRKKFAAENDLDPTKIKIDHIYTRHGGNVSTALLKAYENKTVVDEDTTEQDSEETKTEAEDSEESEEPDEDENDEKEDEE